MRSERIRKTWMSFNIPSILLSDSDNVSLLYGPQYRSYSVSKTSELKLALKEGRSWCGAPNPPTALGFVI